MSGFWIYKVQWAQLPAQLSSVDGTRLHLFGHARSLVVYIHRAAIDMDEIELSQPAFQGPCTCMVRARVELPGKAFKTNVGTVQVHGSFKVALKHWYLSSAYRKSCSENCFVYL